MIPGYFSDTLMKVLFRNNLCTLHRNKLFPKSPDHGRPPMTHLKTILILYIILINIAAFFLMAFDKRAARRHRGRIPEKNLFAAALAGGSIGAMIGMFLFRHKTRRLHFLIGMPLIFVIQLLLIVLLLSWNHRRMSRPSTAVQEQLSLIRSLDENTIDAYISYQNLTNQQVDGTSFGNEASEAVRLFFQNFKYNIKNESINGQEADVTVDITNIDTRALAKDLCTELLHRASGIPGAGTQTFSTGDYYQLLCNFLNRDGYELTVTPAVFHLRQDDSGWIILADEILEDELVSGFISNINDPYLLSPQTVLKAQLDVFDGLNADGWADFLKPDDVFALYNETYSPQIDQAYLDQIAAWFGYDILRCQTEENKAVVDLRITSLNLNSILTQYREKLIKYAESPQSVRDTDEERSDMIASILLDILKNNDSSSSTDIRFTMVNDGNTWTVGLGDDFTNALMGNLSASLDAFRGVESETVERTLNQFSAQLH